MLHTVSPCEGQRARNSKPTSPTPASKKLAAAEGARRQAKGAGSTAQA
jgi:hypothetical protein